VGLLLFPPGDETICYRLTLYSVRAMPDLDKVESLFHEALGLPPDVDRLAWLAAACTGDSGLLREVSTLLDSQALMAGAASTAEVPLPTAQFGAYRAVHLLGRGGMSAVYLAERADGQFEQTVALKVMAGYLADGDFFRRFEAERQFLAALNHHNITRLLDGGLSSSGDPFLVTEYVNGETIDHYCEERKLSISARLPIFLQVCEAVDYAHRNLIVHRDLKPANILVNREGDVKLLDFGTASLTETSQNDRTVTRMRMMTPRYASPEQLRGERVNISTDVFSLGVVLYELLTGAWPFGDPKSMLRESDRASGQMTANPPFTAITEEAATTRSTSREQLSRTLKGDLSAIVLKALESEPSRRYESVRALAADLENFLAGRPVTARPQTPLYHARKFLRRRWLPVSAAAVFVLGLAGASAFAVHQARVARAAAFKAEKVNEFLIDMLQSAGNFGFDTQKTTVAQMLDGAEARLQKGWTGDPKTEADLRYSLGASYGTLLRYDRARPQLNKALDMYRSLGYELEETRTLLRLAEMDDYEGHPDDEVREFEEVFKHLNHMGKNAPPITVFNAKFEFATVLSTNLNRRLPEARTLFEEAIALGNRDSSIPKVNLANAMAHYAGMLHQRTGEYDKAEAMYRQALIIGRQQDTTGTWQAFPMFGLAILIVPKDPAGAVELDRQRYEILARNRGADDGLTTLAMILWARHRVIAGQPGDAVPQALEAMKTVRKHFLPSSMNYWFAAANTAYILNSAKRYKEAESVARETSAAVEANRLPELDGRRAESLLELGKALHGQKRDREAAPLLKRSAMIYDTLHHPTGGNWARAVLSEIK
jgi:serine/threonine protein kinase